MSTIDIRESLRQLDDDTFCKYDLLTMYDSCPLLDEDKQEIAKLLYDKEDPEVIYQKLCTYFCDDDISEIDAFNDFVQPGTFEVIVNECVNRLKESCSDAQYNDVANQLEVIKDGELYTTGLAPIEIETGDIQIFVDGNYDSPFAFDSTENAVNYITDVVLNKLTSTSVDSGDDDVMVYTIYDIVEDDDNRLTAKCMNESTNDFQDIKLGKISSQKVNELLNNMLNNPNYRITDEAKKKIYDNSAPWGLAVQVTSAVDVDGTNGLLSTSDFGGEASFGESIETNFEKDDRVTDGSREGTVLDSDSQKVLVEWDYSETDDIEWVDKSTLELVNEINSRFLPNMEYCPACGGTRFNTKTGVCIDCGYNEGGWGYTNTDDYDDLDESYIPLDKVSKEIEQYLNYHLGGNEDYVKVTNIRNIDKDTVAVEYEVHLSIPIGNDEYERDTEYRSLSFRYKEGKWQPVVTESVYDVKTKTTARKLVDKAKADGKKLSMKDAEEIVDQSYNDKADNIDDFYKSLDLDESHEDDFEPQLPTFNELRKQYKNYTTFKDKEKNSGLIRDLCDQLENKKVSYDIYNHKKDNGMTIFYDDFQRVESLAPYKKEEFKKQLQDELYDKFIDLARTPEWGFENLAEIGDYLIPTIEVNDYEGEYDNDIEVEFRAEVNYREMEDVCNTLDKVVKKYDKNAYFEPVQPGIAVAYLKFPKKLKEDFEDDEIVTGDQEYDSAATSINSNKLPAVYSMVDFTPGQVVIDFGGGRFDNAVNYLKDKDVTLLVYDPYNRSAEHNKEVLRVIRENGGADAAINSNVLNVIKEPEARQQVLKNIKKLVKPGAPIYITVYEGSGKGNEGPTKAGYQLNRKTSGYIDEISQIFPNVKRRGKLITAINESIGPKADKLHELIDEGVISKDLVVDEFIRYLSEDDIADFLNQYDLDELEESSCGEAFDIEDDQYFTKEEIVDVAEEVCEHLDEIYPDTFSVSNVYMETPTTIHIEVISKEGNWASANAKIDMRRVKKPSDIMKYDVVIGDLVYNLRQELEQLYTDNSIFTESASEWRYVDSKIVPDSDGFLTDYTWYENTEDGRHIFIFGDNDLYDADPNYADWEADSYLEAKSWFDNYHGFDDEEDV